MKIGAGALGQEKSEKNNSTPLPGVPRHITAILGGVMLGYLFKPFLRAAILPLVLLALSFASPAQAAPTYPVAGTNTMLHSQSRAQEAGKAVADARAAMVAGNCDQAAYSAARVTLGDLANDADIASGGGSTLFFSGTARQAAADSQALSNLNSQLGKEWSDAQPCGPSEPAMTFTAGAFTGQLDRSASGWLGTEFGGTISPNNFVNFDNDESTTGTFANATFNTTGLDNQLWGDWFSIDQSTSFSTGFNLVHVESTAEQRIDRIPVGAGNRLNVFSPEGQSGGLLGGVSFGGMPDVENALYFNNYKSHTYELKKQVSFETSFGRMSPNVTFGYGGTEITERFSGQVAGFVQDFAFHNRLDVDTYSLGFGVNLERSLGKFADFPVDFYAGASATANFNDHSGSSKLDLNGAVNATEMKSLSGSETTGSYEANVGLSFEINNALEFVVGAQIKSFDVPGIGIAPQQEARVNYDNATELIFKAAIKAGFGNGELFTSDRRLKRNIVHLTTLANGIKLYSFKYLWSDRAHVGVMAQDLLADKKFRHAVIMRDSGFYAVNYAELGLKMAALEAWRETGLAAVMLQPPGILLSSFVENTLR